jgi:serine/threonine protein kinase
MCKFKVRLKMGAKVSKDWHISRLKIAGQVTNTIESLNLEDWKGCIPDVKSIMKEIKPLGKGTFGEVSHTIVDNHPVAIKKALYDDEDKNITPDEYRWLQLTKILIMDGSLPNFILPYHISTCKVCNVGKLSGPCYITYSEKADGDLTHVIDKLGPETQISILFQLLVAITALQMKYQLIHNDIKLANILFLKTHEMARTYIQYDIGSKKYLIENTGLIVLLADFGVSICTSPIFEPSATSQRNFMVKDNIAIPTGEKTTSMGINIQTWIGDNDKKFNTYKIFSRDAQFDLNNPERYPPHVFFIDIQDLVRMFVGGKRATQPGKHPGFPNLSNRLKVLLKEKGDSTIVRYGGTLKLENLPRYFLAHILLDELYSELYLERELSISEHYVLKW